MNEQVLLEPVRRTRLREEAAEQIKSLIRSGQLRPGDKLPSERELVNQLAVSRASVREALRMLENMGLLTVKPGNGTYVREVPIDVLVDPLASWLLGRKEALLHLLEARDIIEPQIAALAARRATPQAIQTMEETLAEVARQSQAGNTEAMAQAIMTFHRCITEAANNSILLRILNTIADLLSESMQETLRIPGRPNKSLANHRRILAAIRAGDAAAASKAMRQHLRSVQEDILAEIGSGEATKAV
jgi:GntR family transcriptional repressor for pyruvate dehydrogenase complex